MAARRRAGAAMTRDQRTAPALRVVEKRDAGQVVGTKPPLVTPGTYNLMYELDETILLGKGRAPKLVTWFRITSHGEFLGVRLPRYYNVISLEGKPRRHGGFKVGWKSGFMRDFATVFESLPSRMNRIPMSKFEGVEIRGRVKTVVSGWDRKDGPLPVALHYSVIEKLLPLTAAVSVTPSVTPVPTPT